MSGNEEMSNLSVGDRRLTWREAAEKHAHEAARLQQLATLLFDLDRCEHGRHEGDVCGSCNGLSHGNPRMSDDRVLGYDISGRPIRHPQRFVGLDPYDVASWHP